MFTIASPDLGTEAWAHNEADAAAILSDLTGRSLAWAHAQLAMAVLRPRAPRTVTNRSIDATTVVVTFIQG